MARGGKREGAGRPLPPDGKRVTITIRVSPKTKESIAYLKAQGIGIGMLVDKMIDEMVQPKYNQSTTEYKRKQPNKDKDKDI